MLEQIRWRKKIAHLEQCGTAELDHWSGWSAQENALGLIFEALHGVDSGRLAARGQRPDQLAQLVDGAARRPALRPRRAADEAVDGALDGGHLGIRAAQKRGLPLAKEGLDLVVRLGLEIGESPAADSALSSGLFVHHLVQQALGEVGSVFGGLAHCGGRRRYSCNSSGGRRARYGGGGLGRGLGALWRVALFEQRIGPQAELGAEADVGPEARLESVEKQVGSILCRAWSMEG